MYYDLSKKEYLEYEKQFKKTYVGKQLSMGRFPSAIVGTILWCVTGGIVGYNSVEAFQITLTEFTFFFIGGLCLLESVLWHIEYRKELKNYILQTNKRKNDV